MLHPTVRSDYRFLCNAYGQTYFHRLNRALHPQQLNGHFKRMCQGLFGFPWDVNVSFVTVAGWKGGYVCMCSQGSRYMAITADLCPPPERGNRRTHGQQASHQPLNWTWPQFSCSALQRVARHVHLFIHDGIWATLSAGDLFIQVISS